MTTIEQAAAFCSLGILRVNDIHPAEAVELLRQAVSMCPDNARYRANLSVALNLLGELEGRTELREQAVTECLEAIRLQPDFVDVMCNLGLILCNLGRPEEALPHLERAVALAPQSGKSIQGCAVALLGLKRWEEAAPYFAKWVELEPNSAAAHLKTGEYYMGQDLWQEAAEHYARALDLDPGSMDAGSGLLACLVLLGRNGEAITIGREVVRLNPNNAIAWANLGCVERRMGRSEAALECFDSAVAIDPGSIHASWGRSLCLLSMGRIQEGWDAYQWGFKTGDRKPNREFVQPRWDGQDLAGQTILVWMEQGLGDHIAFASMIPDLAAAGAHCIIECEYRLVELFQRSFPGIEAIPATEPPNPRTQGADIDFEIPAGSLGRWLRPNLASFSRHGGYLVPDPVRAAGWQARIGALGAGPKIGISWRSLKPKGRYFLDSMELDQWGPILTIPGIHWINLQPGWSEEEVLEIGANFHARLHVWDALDLKDDQDAIAALIPALDLVVTAFTVTAQMAGALGVPAWVLSHVGNLTWWELGTDYCPWHPSIRFFPCGALEPWDASIARLAQELHQRFQL
jgi:tetratricopeptide (TPR) repeat protein